jgi:DNA polymerase III sliding clamp (beta) subunit (PCNA family)
MPPMARCGQCRACALQPVHAAARRFPDDRRRRTADQFRTACPSLIQIIDKTRFAISTEETRYYLNGIFLHVTDDGRSDAEGGRDRWPPPCPRHRAASGGRGRMPDMIVPRKCVAELRKLLDESRWDNAIQVAVGSKIRFTFGSAMLTSKLIDGTFPDYSRVIPTGNDKLLKIDPKQLRGRRRSRATIATEKTRAVKMALDRDKITLSVTSPENGTAAEEVSGRYSDDSFEIGFNARYLLDILGADRRRCGRTAPRRRRRADADPRKRQVARALCADADAGVTDRPAMAADPAVQAVRDKPAGHPTLPSR